MAMTYTTAAVRDAQRSQRRCGGIHLSALALAATSAVAILAIMLAYLGRTSVFDESERRASTSVVNLNTVADAGALESAMAAVFRDVTDRRFAAQQLFRFLVDERQRDRTLPNVGAIARATFDVETVDRSVSRGAFAQRLQVARGNAAAGRGVVPQHIPVLSPADLATLKPLLIVRTRQEFRHDVLLFGCLYIAAFYLPPLAWRLRGSRYDVLLVAVMHLLTAIGFAVLLSRPDPVRDSLLFVRFTEGVVTGVVLMTTISLVDFGAAGFVKLSYLPLIGALSLSALLILFGSGPGSSHARVNLGPLQPIEAIRLLLALFLAGYFARQWELLRELRAPVLADSRWGRWLNMPRAEYAAPVVAGVSLALVFFFLQRDLGPALLLCCVFLA